MRDQANDPGTQAINLAGILEGLWHRRCFILRTTLLFMGVGLLLAVCTPKEYTVQCVLAPQITNIRDHSEMRGLVAITGVSVDLPPSYTLSPLVYPQILSNSAYLKELMQTTVTLRGHAAPVKVLDYCTDKQYRKFSPGPWLKKYTVGLPGLLLGALRSKEPPLPASAGFAEEQIEVLTPQEAQCKAILSKNIALLVNSKEEYLQLTVTMSEPLATAQLAQSAQRLLQEYITRFKVEKELSNHDFIEQRFYEARQEFEARQRALAAFRDANRNIVSSVARTREEQLANEADLAFTIYSELARQLEQARIKVKEMAPVFAVLEPVTVPTGPSAPRRILILGLSFSLGLMTGILLALGLLYGATLFDTPRLDGWRAPYPKK